MVILWLFGAREEALSRVFRWRWRGLFWIQIGENMKAVWHLCAGLWPSCNIVLIAHLGSRFQGSCARR